MGVILTGTSPYTTKTIMGSVALYGRPDLSGRGQALTLQILNYGNQD